MVEPEGDLIKQRSRNRLYEICEWGLANVIKQHLGLSRAGAQNQITGEPPKNVSDLLTEIPFGSTVNISQTASPPPKSRAGWLPTLGLAALTGAGGFFVGQGLSSPSEPEKVVDAVIEWEILYVESEQSGAISTGAIIAD